MRTTELWQTRPATPEDVLWLLREELRHRSAWDPEVDAGAVLTFDTSIAEWMEAGDLLTHWKTLAPVLNTWLGVDFAPEDWRELLTPPKRPLRDLCERVAPRLRVPVLPAFRMAGVPCATAGAFLTLRTALVRAGLPVAGARPSEPLRLHTWEQVLAFTRTLAWLAPGVLPPARIRGALAGRLSGLAFLGGLVLTVMAGALPSVELLPVLGPVLLLGGFAGLWLSRNAAPADVRFEGLSTLGDVARALAAPRVVESPPC